MPSLRLLIALHASVAVLGNLEVVSYNLYWWNVGQNNRWQALYDVIEGQSFDLIGFQVPGSELVVSSEGAVWS